MHLYVDLRDICIGHLWKTNHFYSDRGFPIGSHITPQQRGFCEKAKGNQSFFYNCFVLTLETVCRKYRYIIIIFGVFRCD